MSGDDEYWSRDMEDKEKLESSVEWFLKTMGLDKDVKALMPRPEWWSPSEYLVRSRGYPEWIKLSLITSLGKTLREPDEGDNPLCLWIGERGTFTLYYDTPEHRDEDFTRLKLALGVE